MLPTPVHLPCPMTTYEAHYLLVDHSCFTIAEVYVFISKIVSCDHMQSATNQCMPAVFLVHQPTCNTSWSKAEHAH